MTFTLTRQQLEAKRSQLASQGVELTGDSGKIEKNGVTVQFTYGEPTLVVTVLDFGGHPSFFVNHAISGWFKH